MAGLSELSQMTDKYIAADRAVDLRPKSTAGMQAVSQMGNIATQSLRSMIVAKGQESIDQGLKELKEAGMSNPALEQSFATLDYSNPEMVGKALSAMSKLVQEHRADKRSMEYGRGKLQGLLDQRIKEAESQSMTAKKDINGNMVMGTDGKPVMETKPLTQSQRFNAMELAKRELHQGAGLDLDIEALGGLQKRFPLDGLERDASTTATGQNAKRLDRAQVMKMLRGSGWEAMPSFAIAIDKVNEIVTRRDGDTSFWGFQANNPALRRAGNFLQSVADKLSSPQGIRDSEAMTLAQQIESTFKNLGSAAAQSASGMTKDQRQDLNALMTGVGIAAAQYIRSISGAAATDVERAALLSNMGVQNMVDFPSFAASFNLVTDELENRVQAVEELAQGYGSVFDEVLADLGGKLPSSVLGGRRMKLPSGVKKVEPGDGLDPEPPEGYTRGEPGDDGVPQAKNKHGAILLLKGGKWVAKGNARSILDGNKTDSAVTPPGDRTSKKGRSA